MLEVKPTGSTATGCDRNGKEAVAGAGSEAFARWPHHRCAPVELPSAHGISFCHAIPCCVHSESISGLLPPVVVTRV